MTETYGAMADFDDPALPRATVDPNETLWNMQGGASHKFAYLTDSGVYTTRTVNDYAYIDKAYAIKTRQIEELDNWLTNAVGEYETDMLQEIADIFGIMLERSWSFDVTVRFTGTFTCPPDVDPETVVDNLTFSLDESYYLPDGTSIDDSDYQVESSDWSEA